MKIEKDHAEIYTGVRHGKSLGSPIGLILPNADFENWTTKMSSKPVDNFSYPHDARSAYTNKTKNARNKMFFEKN